MTLFSFSAQAQITGKVYRDFNANGTQDTPISSTASATGEPGFPGIVVMAYPATGSPVSVTTGIDGSYSFPNSGATASGAKLRLEFSGLPSGVYSAAYGTATTGSGTSVQFVTAGGTAVANYGIHYPGEYCDSSPQLATPCFVSGTQSAASVANEHVLVTFPYSAQSTNSGTLANPVASNTVNPTPIADAGHVGSVWGMAYQRESNKLFTTALLKRHVGLGSGGLGGIYSTSNATGSTVNGSLYVDLEAAPFSLDLGQSLLGTRTLPATPTASSTDPNAFSLIGVVGLGGLAISDDGTKLYTVDLYNKKLLILNIGTPAKASPSADDLTQVLIPTPSCTNGVARPFGVSVYHEKVYVGVVCTAESASGVAANLTMSVFEMDGATQTFNPTAVLNAPLNYPKGYVHAQQIALGDRWEPWTSSFSTMNTTQLTASPLVFRTAQPQPILSDIDFTDNGDMVLTLMDRAGHQLGYRQASPAGGTTLYSGYIGGDLLRARKQGTTWVLESAGRVSSSTSGTLTGGSTNNAQGPGSGEFYSNDNYVGDNDANGVADEIHQETSQGGSVIVRGTNQTVTIHMDPMATWSGGTIWHNNTTGLRSKVYQLYRTIDNSGSQVNGTYGKANGLGLPVALCDPAPVEIGNRIWLDTNKDGIQDPAETPIASVSVGLYNSGTLVATAVTNAKGEYYFSSAPGTSSTAVRYNLALIRGGAYELRILRTQPALANFETLSPTDANTNGTDAIDNDFALSGSNLVTSLTVGMSGNNLHLFDAGVTPVPPCSLTLAALPGACDPLTNTYALSGTITLTSNNTAGTATVTDGARSTTVSVPSGATSVVWSLTGFASNGANHTAIVTLTNCGTASTTYAAPASCTACSLSITTTSLPDGQVGAVYSQSIAATGGTGSLTYTVSGGSLPTGLNLGASTGVIAGTPTVAATSSFAVKVTDTKGCTAVVPLTIMTSALPVCSLTLSAIPGPCVPATNTYAITGTISLTNNTAGGTAIITDGSATTTVVIAPNATSANFTLSGLLSNGTTHLVSVSLTGCGISSTTYSAPVSCSAAPLKASLGDYVWLDTNKNGQQDGAESGVPSVTVVLCDATSGSAISTTLTDSQGKYLFSNLDPGSYTVKFTAPDGTTFTTPNSGTDATDSDVASLTGQKGSTGVYSLSAGEQNLTVDAGLVPTSASLGDKVFVDNNKNGIQDAGDTPLAGVTVTLISNGTVVATTTTASSGTGIGCYSFTGLTPGVPYSVSFTTPPNHTATTPNSGTNDAADSDPVNGITAPVTLTAGENNPTLDAGFIPLKASLGDYVWLDTNKDGQQAGESGVQNVTVVLCDATSGSAISTTLTDSQGKYLFSNLDPGSYTVKFTAPDGTTFTTPNSGTDATDSDVASLTGQKGSTGVYSLSAGEQNLTVDAGLVPTSASLGDKVFVDNNKNGIQDAGDTPLAGVTVTLISNGTVVATTTTASSGTGIGCYSFTGLTPGVPYSVSFTTPPNHTATTPNSGTNDAADSDPVNGITAPVTLTAGENNPTLDAGFIPLKASLGDYVWLDTNKNGQQDGAESGVQNVTVVLCGATSGSAISTTLTDSQGKYLFSNLDPGSYTVKFTAPDGTTFTTPNSGSDATDSDVASLTGQKGSTGVYSLSAGEQNLTVDAGLVPTTTPLGSIGDFVWKDANKNGIQDDGPNSGMSNVRVNLLRETTPGQFTVVATTTTSTSGLYSFTGLTAGNYVVRVDLTTVPFYCEPTAQTVVTPNDATNSKIDASGTTPVIVINPGNPAQTDYPKADAGFSPVQFGSIGDYVWKDTNNDGIQNDGATAVGGVGLKLLNSDGFYIIRGTLSGAQENPAVTTNGTGMAYAGFNPTTNELLLEVGFNGLSGSVTMAHIHTGVTGTNGPVTIDLVPQGFPTGVQAGNFAASLTLTAAQKTLLMSNKLYVNVHTSTNGGGEVRAQLVACEFTNSAGAYLFDKLPEDTYKVAVDTPTLPTTCVVSSMQNSTAATEATDSDFDPATGQSGFVSIIPSDPDYRDIRTVDLALTGPTKGTIGDMVWKDINNNGQYDVTESGASGVRVRLLQVTSPVGSTAISTSLVSSTTTGTDGKYVFSSVPAGRYVLEVDKTTLPTNCTISPKVRRPGVPDALDSDADPVTGQTPVFEINPADPATLNRLTLDVALINPDCQPVCLPITIQRIR